jgi:glycine oxidase
VAAAADRQYLIRVMPAQGEMTERSQIQNHASYDAIVVGAGVIGLATGWRAAQRGLRTLVIDRDAPAAGATGVAAGMLAPVSEAAFGEEELLALNLAAAAGYERFVAELGCDVGYRACGTLAVALDRDEAEVLQRQHRFHRSLDLESQWLRGSECRKIEPGLSPRVVGGFRTTVDHQVDPRALSSALALAFSDAGGELRSSDPVASLAVRAGRVAGVELESGQEIAAGNVVVACGWRSGEIAGLPASARVPVRPVKGQILRLRERRGSPIASRVVRTPEVYLVPREQGELVVGATVEERGADDSVTAGGVLELLRWAYEVLPGVTELELVETAAGLRPCAPDNKPIVGHGALPGLLWATAHWRNGILLAPVTADAVAALLAGEDMPAELEPFAPDRFAASDALTSVEVPG